VGYHTCCVLVVGVLHARTYTPPSFILFGEGQGAFVSGAWRGLGWVEDCVNTQHSTERWAWGHRGYGVYMDGLTLGGEEEDVVCSWMAALKVLVAHGGATDGGYLSCWKTQHIPTSTTETKNNMLDSSHSLVANLVIDLTQWLASLYALPRATCPPFACFPDDKTPPPLQKSRTNKAMAANAKGIFPPIRNIVSPPQVHPLSQLVPHTQSEFLSEPDPASKFESDSLSAGAPKVGSTMANSADILLRLLMAAFLCGRRGAAGIDLRLPTAAALVPVPVPARPRGGTAGTAERGGGGGRRAASANGPQAAF